jgi:hypothetical protein
VLTSAHSWRDAFVFTYSWRSFYTRYPGVDSSTCSVSTGMFALTDRAFRVVGFIGLATL